MNNLSLSQVTSRFFSKVYGWMSFGLLLTAAVGAFTASSSWLINLIFKPFVFWPLFISQFCLVSYLSTNFASMSYNRARNCFIAYSCLTGLTISAIFIVFTLSSIAAVFLICSGMFATMALYGHFTESDLSSMGSFLFMLLIGMLLASLVNSFLGSAQFDYMLSILGVIVFSLFTAYDAQKIKTLVYNFDGTATDFSKISIMGALTLYLDFINLFLHLLRLLGRRRN